MRPLLISNLSNVLPSIKVSTTWCEHLPNIRLDNLTFNRYNQKITSLLEQNSTKTYCWMLESKKTLLLTVIVWLGCHEGSPFMPTHSLTTCISSVKHKMTPSRYFERYTKFFQIDKNTLLKNTFKERPNVIKKRIFLIKEKF